MRNNINYNVGPANYNGSNIGTNAVVNNGVGHKMSMGANARMNTSTMPNNIGNSKSTTVRASTTTKKYSNDLSKSWPKIVNDLKQNGKIVLYTNLMNTSAEQINDNTVGIKFKKGMTAFGKAVLDKQENIKEISSLISLACGKDMQIKYINDAQNSVAVHNPEDDIQRLASESNIPFNMM